MLHIFLDKRALNKIEKFIMLFIPLGTEFSENFKNLCYCYLMLSDQITCLCQRLKPMLNLYKQLVFGMVM